MREIAVEEISKAVADLCIRANRFLTDDMKFAMEKGRDSEVDSLPKEVMSDLVRNYELAEELRIPVCQDTGITVVFLELGQEVHVVGGDLYDSVNQGVSNGYIEGLLRLSVVKDPMQRANTGNNTPAVIHTTIVPGDKLSITVAPKGAGSENMSALKMMSPSSSREEVMEYIVEVMRAAGGNPCPPVVIGVGIGGTFEQAAISAKKALCRSLNEENPDPYYNQMEKELLEQINGLGIGPEGFGGKTTALGVHIRTYGTHIASLPVAVNMGCYATRHATVQL